MLLAALVAGLQGLPPMDTPAPLQLAPIANGPFKASLESLKDNHYPTWFTEGKLGIWAHWGPQAVPMEGDWYARIMYEEGSKDYKDHLTRFGHPSKHGYKDIIPLWKAEKWDPERLMGLYKAAGATYFVSMGAHHDNFDLWDSTYHRWNAVKMGPHRDVVGEWQKAAKRHRMRFGVSEHLGASWTWFQKSRGADKEGPFKGVPYNGNDPAYEDLYHPAALPGDTGWYTTDPRWHAEWYRRVKDVVDKYHPDLLYSDGPLPFGHVGESLVAHFYNTTMRGKEQQAVYACKQPSEGRWAQDVERGVMARIQEHPWQTDTSIGDWYYNRNWKYRGADWVIHTLVDVISKNGNLLINVVQRPDGSLDPEAEQVLADMAAWMKVNSESIYGTSPWLVFGEGPTRAKGGAFKEDFGFTAQDVRYVQKGDVVYATLMGNPSSREVTMVSLQKGASDRAVIRDVSVLGSPSKVAWNWDGKGLHVTLPSEVTSPIAVVLKISGTRMREFHSIPEPYPALPVEPKPTVTPDAAGVYRLTPESAEVPEDGVRVESKDGVSNLGYWDNPLDIVQWNVELAPGKYELTAWVASEQATSLEVDAAGARTFAPVPATGGWEKFVELRLGELTVSQGGKMKVTARAHNPATWHALNLRKITLRKL
jgi:alpha-L-fucosidase